MSFKIGYGACNEPGERHEMIVCMCTGATDNAIRNLIREGAESVAEIVRRSGCGRCCAPCRQEIAVILCQQLTTVSE